MKTTILSGVFLITLGFSVALAQPANDNCATAQTVLSTSCVNGTTVGANDSWVGSVGCQPGGNNNDVWYSFVATDNQLNINVTSGGIGGNVHFVLAESPCGSCACSFVIVGSSCGAAPLVDSIVGLSVGATYYYTISSDGAAGAFTSCITNLAAVNRPGQDCNTASNICGNDPFGQTTVASGNGAIRGIGSEEDVDALSCFGSQERQSQWYRFTASRTGTIEFNINPLVSSNDYDFLLLDVTTSGCNLRTGPASVVACNWSGCRGSTGISSSIALEPGVVTGGAGCFGGPAAWSLAPPTITACRNYLLLIDNFSLTNNGFNFTWGGAGGGMTAEIGPSGALGFTTSAVSSCSPCQISVTPTVNLACYTYEYSWGDGTTSTGASPGTHTYTVCGTYTITQTIRDANGCEATTSATVDCNLLPSEEIQLTASANSLQTRLDWSIPSEPEIKSIRVQHSADGRNFNEIGFHERQNNGTIALTMNHQSPVMGRNYYRLNALDAEGHTMMSNVATAVFNGTSDVLTVFPVPATDWVDLNYEAAESGFATIQLMDAQGRLMMQSDKELVAGAQTIRMNLNGYAAGLYFVQIQTQRGTLRTQLLKQEASR